MKNVVSCVVLLCANLASAQGWVPVGATPVQQQPAVVVSQNVNQNTAQNAQAPMVPVVMPPQPGMMPMPMPPAPPQVPAEWLANGYREEFTKMDRHDVRPLRDWESQPYQQPQYYPPNGYYPQQPAYPNYTYPSYTYPQYSQYTQPQYPSYSYPQYYSPSTYCPQYTQPTYCQPQSYCTPQCQQVYCPRSSCYPQYTCPQYRHGGAFGLFNNWSF